MTDVDGEVEFEVMQFLAECAAAAPAADVIYTSAVEAAPAVATVETAAALAEEAAPASAAFAAAALAEEAAPAATAVEAAAALAEKAVAPRAAVPVAPALRSKNKSARKKKKSDTADELRLLAAEFQRVAFAGELPDVPLRARLDIKARLASRWPGLKALQLVQSSDGLDMAAEHVAARISLPPGWIHSQDGRAAIRLIVAQLLVEATA